MLENQHQSIMMSPDMLEAKLKEIDTDKPTVVSRRIGGVTLQSIMRMENSNPSTDNPAIILSWS